MDGATFSITGGPMGDATPGTGRPNILLILNDQERQRDWIPDEVDLPARQRLIDSGLEFTNYYTHTSPCSPSRASLFTGQYVFQHGVTENSSGGTNTELATTTRTLGHMLREVGYRTGYKGKWHLQARPDPEMDAFGFGDWEGNDMAWWGLPGTGTEFDDPIAEQSAAWIRGAAQGAEPWFLTAALVNPHDIMWYPLDQPWWQERNPGYFAIAKERLERRDWGRAMNLPPFEFPVPERFSELPANFDDDLHTKPDVHRRWMHEMVRYGTPGEMPHSETELWLRQLDYYLTLHELNDAAIATVLGALDEVGGWNDTIVIFTSDHGDQCGSHGLRSKGPWNYQETMRIPLYLHIPGQTAPGSKTHALTTHPDLAVTIAELAGVTVGDEPGLVGESLLPLVANQETSVRDYVLFAQEWPWYPGVEQTRYASTGIFDGRDKYCRYYGVGGGHDAIGVSLPGEMRFTRDSSFSDHDHEWYDLSEDPHELVNLALDRGQRGELRRRFDELMAIEAVAYAPIER